MKKLVLLFALVFAVGMVMAQTNVSTVIENGTGNTATVDQQGNGMGDNNSYIEQSSSDNAATVTQINPVSGVDDDINSTVLQSGKKNVATVEQTHNRSGQWGGPGGTLNAFIDQSGDKNEALQVQGPHSQMGATNAEIYQSGNKNFASQHQVKYWNVAIIDQQGDRNTAMQAQDTELLEDAEGSANHASITQIGNDNMATQRQHGWDNEAYIHQGGSGNTAIQNQKNYSWVNWAVIEQGGNNNYALQDQEGFLNNAYINQASNGNTATQIQYSGARRTGADYTPLNQAEITQTGGVDNEAIQTQNTPGGNIVMNYAWTLQDGAHNYASQTQTEGFNHSTVSQTGNGNHAEVTQSQSIVQP